MVKKILVWLSVGMLALGAAGCGRQGTENGGSVSQTEEPAAPADTPASTADPTQEPQNVPGVSDAGGSNYAEGWSDEMEAMKTAVTDLLGDNYFPNMALEPDMLEALVGITPDMYDDYFAEIPMISTNVDTLIVVKAAEGQGDAVEETLKAYRDGQVGATMQYPQNVGKIQASKVERSGDYVIFALLGGDIMDLLDEGDAAVITYCQEINDDVIQTITEVLK